MNPALVWFLLGLTFLGVELMAPHLVLIFFGAGAWIAALIALMGGGLIWQLSGFIIFSIASLLLLRRHLAGVFGGKTHETCSAADGHAPEHPLTGRLGIAPRAFHPGEVGEVQVDGSFWRATAETTIPEGPVRVLGVLPENVLILRVAALGDNSSSQQE